MYESLNFRKIDMLLSLHSPAAAGLDHMPQDLVIFLTHIWLNKPFVLEKLLAVCFFV